MRRTTAVIALAAVGAIVGSTLLATPASARPWPGHAGRSLVNHIVRPGDTATGLAVRYHAWTDELIALHHGSSLLVVGEKVRIPVVIAAARKANKAHRATHHVVGHHAEPRHHAKHRTHLTRHEKAMRAHGWKHWRMSRTQVRHLVARKAHQRGFDGRLAQAVAWQESGWRQPVRSSAGAIGVMQVMPSTGRWIGSVKHRHFNLRNTYDNVDAGVSLLRLLRQQTSAPKQAVAAYYQGLGALKEHGWYGETHRYVRSVLAIKRTLKRTGHPVR